MEFPKLVVGVLVVLVLLAVVMFWLVMTHEAKQPKAPGSSVVASQDLRAYTKLVNGHLECNDTSRTEALTKRYLLVDVKKGGEVREEMVAAGDATSVLNDAVLFSIPASATTSLGGQLRAGELVNLVAVPTTGPAKPFENLVVLSSTQPTKDGPPTTIMLAVPNGKRDEFAAAITSAQLLVSRKIVVNQ